MGLKGSVAAAFLRLKGIKDLANRPIYDVECNALCCVMRGGSVGIIGLFFLKTALWAYVFVERSGFL